MSVKDKLSATERMRQIAHIEAWSGRMQTAEQIAHDLNITARLVRYYQRRPQYAALLERENRDYLDYMDDLDFIETHDARKTWAGVLLGWGGER